MDVYEVVERWRETIPEENQTEATAAVGLIGIGIGAAALALVRRRSGFFAWALPGALLAAGIAMLANVVWDLRGERMAQTRLAIEAQLEELDPVARAQVLRDVARDQVGELLPGID
jgi:hypothetical protein